MRNSIFLLVALISCYLFESWLPIPETFSLSNIILVFVMNPVKVFAAAIAFLIGFITNGIFIRNRFFMARKIIQKKGKVLPEVLYIILFMTSFYFLCKLGFWQTIIFFSFAFLYGMMTIEKKQLNSH